MDLEELAEQLARIRDKRGYLLPHHGLMATALPGMLEAYDDLYSSLALTERALDRYGHEVVWLAVLIAVNEALGTHHIQRFRQAGGKDSELAAIVSLAGFCRGASAWQFVAESWSPHVPDYDARDDFRLALQRAALDIDPVLAQLSALAAFACTGEWALFRWQLADAYRAEVPEPAIAEALSLIAFPGSVPNFARACGLWRELIADGTLPASARFRTWAKLAGQGGYDEASGVSGRNDPEV